MFIQVIQGHVGQGADQDRLRAHLDRWARELAGGATGWLGSTHGYTDGGEFVGVVRFESEDAAAANAARPDQQEWWKEAEACFDGPVDFLDSSDVSLLLEGGADDAGFVQVIRGRTDDPARVKSFFSRDADMLHELRPEIIGASLALAPDGTWVETVAFTDEASARRGETVELPEDVREELGSIMAGATFHDLRRPWFASPG